MTFPPRLRGWTPAAVVCRLACVVSPALAGMDPAASRATRAPIGFPRACGDGPCIDCAARPSASFPPRLRGWTHEIQVEACARNVSPALAGMDLLLAQDPLLQFRFPRACGDGPARVDSSTFTTRFPPRLRGWTFDFGRPGGLEPVSPALAGMDLVVQKAAKETKCFPRACGDGPVSRPASASIARFPPRLRGWTHLVAAAVRCVRVSPALAGMDPSAFPGGGPPIGFPRACGDGPCTARSSSEMWVFPPRLRGWTLTEDQRAKFMQVSPALAGMDLIRTS